MFKKPVGKAAGGITTPEFVIAAALLLFLEAILLFNFLIKPNMASASAARAELESRRAALAQYRGEKSDAESQSGRLEALRAQIAEAEIRLPPALHNEDIAISIGRYAQANNVSIEAVSFSERQLIDTNEYAFADGGASGGGSGGVGAQFEQNTQNAQSAQNTQGVRYNATDATDGGVNPGAVGMARQSALYDDGITSGRTLSVQGVQISFRSEFHTIGPFLKFLEEGERLARVKNVSVSRIQESELKGVVNLEYVSLSPDAERGYSGLYAAGAPGAGGGAKSSLFEKYAGYVEEGADPTILLLSEEEDIDPDFYMVIKASSSNETKVGYGVYPRVETEVRSNVNNAVRAKLTIDGDEEQFEYVYSLASQQKSERRKLGAEGGKLRMKILSCPRTGENDAVAVLLDVENNTALPLEITVVNDDVLNPRFHVGIVTANVSVANR